MNHTPYGDYEKPLSDWSEQYRKTHGVLKADFSYDLIPFDIMKNYAAMDAVVTFLLYEKMRSAIEKNNKLLFNGKNFNSNLYEWAKETLWFGRRIGRYKTKVTIL